jgi:hypothetical protein
MLKTLVAATAIALAPLAASLATAHADTPQEDQPGWSCVDDGNHACGPNNAQGAPAGCYDEGGVLVASWPCRWATLPDGMRVLYTHDGGSELYYPIDAEA